MSANATTTTNVTGNASVAAPSPSPQPSQDFPEVTNYTNGTTSHTGATNATKNHTDNTINVANHTHSVAHSVPSPSPSAYTDNTTHESVSPSSLLWKSPSPSVFLESSPSSLSTHQATPSLPAPSSTWQPVAPSSSSSSARNATVPVGFTGQQIVDWTMGGVMIVLLLVYCCIVFRPKNCAAFVRYMRSHEHSERLKKRIRQSKYNVVGEDELDAFNEIELTATDGELSKDTEMAQKVVETMA